MSFMPSYLAPMSFPPSYWAPMLKGGILPITKQIIANNKNNCNKFVELCLKINTNYNPRVIPPTSLLIRPALCASISSGISPTA